MTSTDDGTTATPAAPVPREPTCAARIGGSLDATATAAQLLIVGSPLAGPVSASTAVIGRIAPGGVFLAGRSRAGVDTVRARTDRLQQAAPDRRIGVLVAADQEGGQVQALSGPGFSTIPSATEQGGWSTLALTGAASRWGGELRAAGVDLDLAPVSDVLLASLGNRNLSVGISRRTFGTSPDAVGGSVVAFLAGLRRSGVAATVKHFPGLGAVPGNTDFSAIVRDTTTSATSTSLGPFRAAIAAGVPVVMVSSATYTGIDRTQPAAFSPAVVHDLLRGTLGFAGVVVSDDLGGAAAVAAVPQPQRAVRFVAAGGDMVLTVDPAGARAMLDGLTARMAIDPHFSEQVDAAAARILALKDSHGLLHC